jgi:hypothetical protein
MRCLLLVVLCTALPLRAARAGTCPLPEGAAPELALVDDGARLRFVSEAMRDEARRSRRWAWGWGLGLSAVTATQGAFLLLDGPGTRVDQINGMFTSTVGWGQVVLMPPKILADQRRLAEREADTTADPCQLLAFAEALLARDAAHQGRQTGLLAHLGGVTFNVSVALVLGFGFDLWRSAAVQATVGTAVGAIKTFSQPQGSMTALRDYRAGRLGRAKGADGVAWGLVPIVGAQGARGLGLVLVF